MARKKSLKRRGGKFTRKKEYKKKALKRSLIAFIALALPAATVFAGYKYFYNTDHFIDSIAVIGNSSISTEVIEQAVS